MPAIITHDTFGNELFEQAADRIGDNRDELAAFLLGNQGPDPFLYTLVDPRLSFGNDFARTLHADVPDEFVMALDEASGRLPVTLRQTGRAYVLGYLCHFELDSVVHPFVYAQVYDICDAGVEGLSREDSGEVHVTIERELDELVLTTRVHKTLDAFDPVNHVLRGGRTVLSCISLMYEQAARAVYRTELPADFFTRAVYAYRFVNRVAYSPHGIKRTVLANLELLMRRHSFVSATSHRNVARADSVFANSTHSTWRNPFTGARSDASFDDLYEQARKKALRDLELLSEGGFDARTMHAVSGGLDFAGRPVETEGAR